MTRPGVDLACLVCHVRIQCPIAWLEKTQLYACLHAVSLLASVVTPWELDPQVFSHYFAFFHHLNPSKAPLAGMQDNTLCDMTVVSRGSMVSLN